LLAGGVAHDFNNVLAAIVANLEIARRRVVPGEDADSALAAIGTALARAQSLVRQILTFSSHRQVERQRVRLQDVVAECAALLRASLAPSVVLEVDADPACRDVLADATQMHQVIMNLISNAAHAVGERGRIRVTLVDAQDEGAFAKLTIEDTGIGMDARTQAQIFDPFFTTRGEQEGTGLGLSVVHGIVASHGGTITVKSAPGEGAVFEVRVPLADASARAFERRPPEASPRPALERVLFVDDELRLAQLAQRMLGEVGYRVTTCANGAAALDALRASTASFDVIVTDHTMPGMSGLELAARISAIHPGMPIVLIGGCVEEISPTALRAAGVTAAVAKPFAISELANRMRDAIASRGK
jgi:CheY-like chemotaxis protein/two-component sensor histidine kinase